MRDALGARPGAGLKAAPAIFQQVLRLTALRGLCLPCCVNACVSRSFYVAADHVFDCRPTAPTVVMSVSSLIPPDSSVMTDRWPSLKRRPQMGEVPCESSRLGRGRQPSAVE
jgi:hypothetical protein